MSRPLRPSDQPYPGPAAGHTAGQLGAAVAGGVLLLVGLLGFVPGVTGDYGAMLLAGPRSAALLFGVFAVSVLHNIVHLASGLAGLWMSRTPRGARLFLRGGGALYLALWVYGLVVDRTSAANVLPVDSAGNWLHLGLAVGLIGLGLVPDRRR